MPLPRRSVALAALWLVAPAAIAQGAVWAPVGGQPNGVVHALATDAAGGVYAGGDFTAIGGAPMGRIARWDGNAWSNLGGGLNGSVKAIAVDPSGTVYAAGAFSATAGGSPLSRIARWDGTAWLPVGQGLNDTVYALATDAAGTLHAGGSFTGSGSNGGLSRVATWNGTSWSGMGTGVTWPSGPVAPAVYALATDSGGDVYAGGNFDTAGGVAAEYLARWNGTSWSALGVGVAGTVNALATAADGSLYAGGAFTTLGPPAWTPAAAIARWNGVSWSTLGAGLNPGSQDGIVYALSPDPSGGLYAGGYFTSAGAAPAGMLAQWTGSAWAMPGPWLSTTSSVHAVARDSGGTLYAGGTLVTAPGAAVTHLARLLPGDEPAAGGPNGTIGGTQPSGGSPATPAPGSTRRKLAGRWVFNTATLRGTTSGSPPAGATRIVQAARTGAAGATATRARGTCRITTVRNAKTRKVTRRAYRCTIRLGRGTWTITTTARGAAGVVAEGTRRVVVK